MEKTRLARICRDLSVWPPERKTLTADLLYSVGLACRGDVTGPRPPKTKCSCRTRLRGACPILVNQIIDERFTLVRAQRGPIQAARRAQAPQLLFRELLPLRSLRRRVRRQRQ